jgi:hypothetical protein
MDRIKSIAWAAGTPVVFTTGSFGGRKGLWREDFFGIV